MSAPHFFLDAVDAEQLTITGDDAHHAVRALRIRVGEEITVSDGRGNVARATVRDVTGGRRDARLLADVTARRVEPQPAPRVIVCPAVPKTGKLDGEVQRLTELGVDEIRPWVAARSVPRWDEAKAAAQGERLRAVAREAAKQSRRAWLPVVADPGSLAVGGSTIVLHEEEHRRLRDAMGAGGGDAVTLVIGPEGGLTPEELNAFEEAGARVAGLGPTVLRTETAVIVGAALILGHLGRVG